MGRRRGCALALAGLCAELGALGAGAAELAPRRHLWPHARGHPGNYSLTEHKGPRSMRDSLAWTWHHPEGRWAAIAAGAVLDADANIYLSCMDGIRKFSPGGALLWFHAQNGPRDFISSMPSLEGDLLLCGTMDAQVLALSTKTGATVWSKRVAEGQHPDAPCVEAIDGVVTVAAGGSAPVGMLDNGASGNRLVVALNASNGNFLWEFNTDEPLKNFMPMTNGDGTIVFMDVRGGLYRLGLHNGSLIWHVPVASPWRNSATGGGVFLGHNDVAYTCSNQGVGLVGTSGVVRAFALDDGRLLWDRELPLPCSTWPALSREGETLVVPSGATPMAVSPAYVLLPKWLPSPVMIMVHILSLALGSEQPLLWRNPPLEAEVLAFDARTGESRWSYKVPPWTQTMAKSDERFFIERSRVYEKRPACGPMSWSSPTIDGRGNVYVGNLNGLLYGLRDANGDGRIEGPDEVDTFDTDAGFLPGGAAFGPGLMAIASCDTLWVFRS